MCPTRQTCMFVGTCSVLQCERNCVMARERGGGGLASAITLREVKTWEERRERNPGSIKMEGVLPYLNSVVWL